MENIQLPMLKFDIRGDDRGNLIALEENQNIPFSIKRVYYIFNTPNDVRRGFHAHRETRQLAICLSGSCKVLMDDGSHKEIVELNSNTQGLLIEPLIWHEMYDFSDNCLFLVLANEHYDENDYIRNYQDFEKTIEANK